MTKYDYDWLIRQYKQELGDINEDEVVALKNFINTKSSRSIYYDLAILYFYKIPASYIKFVAHKEVRQAVRGTVLAPYESLIVKKMLKNAKNRALKLSNYRACDRQSDSGHEESSKKEFLSLIKDKIIKILAIKA